MDEPAGCNPFTREDSGWRATRDDRDIERSADPFGSSQAVDDSFRARTGQTADHAVGQRTRASRCTARPPDRSIHAGGQLDAFCETLLASDHEIAARRGRSNRDASRATSKTSVAGNSRPQASQSLGSEALNKRR